MTDVQRAAESGVSSGSRAKAFRVVAQLMAWSAIAFGLATAAFAVLGEGQEVHAFHNAVVAALLLVLSAPPAIGAARAPERSDGPLLHLIALGVAAVATMALGLRPDIFTLPFVLLAGVLVVLRSPRPQVVEGRPSVALGVMVAAAAVPLIWYALGQAELQRLDAATEHAELNHWVETSFYAVAVLLLGGLAAWRPRAFRMSAWSAGVALAVLGGASLGLQGYASALDAPWAWAALVGGLAFVVGAEWEVGRASARGGAPTRGAANPNG